MIATTTILQHLRRERRLIEFCMSSNMLSTIGEYGYEEKRFQEGIQIYDETVTLVKAQKEVFPGLFDRASETYNKVAAIYYEYRRIRKISKVALRKHPATLPTLNLHERIPNHIPTWISQSGQFYGRLLENGLVSKHLSRFNIHKEILVKHAEMIAELEVIEELNSKESDEYQRELDKLYSAVEKLNDWTEDLRSVIRICFDSDPEIMNAVDNFMKA